MSLSLRAGRLGLDLAPQAGGRSRASRSMASIDLLRPMTAEADRLGQRQQCRAAIRWCRSPTASRRPPRLRRRASSSSQPQLAGRAPSHAWRRLGAGLGAWRAATATSAEIVYEHERAARRRLAVPLSRPPVLSSRRRPADDRHLAREPRGPARAGRHRAASVLRARRRHRARLPHPGRSGAPTPRCCRSERIAVPPDWDFARSRKVDEVTLDNCFDGWDGRATIVLAAGRRLRLDLEATAPFRHLVIYVPPGQPYFCVEPVSHANGRVGLAPLGAGRDAGRRGRPPSLQPVRATMPELRFLSQPQGPRRLRLGRRLGHRRLDRRAFRRAGRQGGLRRYRRAGVEGARRQDRGGRPSGAAVRRSATCATCGLPGGDRRDGGHSSARSPCWSTTPRATTGTSSRT